MKLSRVGILFVLLAVIISGANCSYYNKLIARRNLVDGAQAYKDRKFAEAEKFFRAAVVIDPEAKTEEGKTARLFLARTLHSIYAGSRTAEGAKAKAEEAIKNYRAAVAEDINDQSSYNAVASLYETFMGQYPEEKEKWLQEWEQWVSARAENTSVDAKYRADAYTSLASKQYTCANEISDVPDKVKKTVKKDGKDVYEYVKPENPDDYTKFTQCVQKGVELIDKAVALETDEARNAKSVEIKPMTAQQIAKFEELVKIWARVWSYKRSLMNQSMRWADMDDRTQEQESFKAKADEARAKFLEFTAIEKKVEAEKDERARAADPAMANANTNANSANTGVTAPNTSTSNANTGANTANTGANNANAKQ